MLPQGMKSGYAMFCRASRSEEERVASTVQKWAVEDYIVPLGVDWLSRARLGDDRYCGAKKVALVSEKLLARDYCVVLG